MSEAEVCRLSTVCEWKRGCHKSHSTDCESSRIQNRLLMILQRMAAHIVPKLLAANPATHVVLDC